VDQAVVYNPLSQIAGMRSHGPSSRSIAWVRYWDSETLKSSVFQYSTLKRAVSFWFLL
jgi:hypothetical protein